MDVERAREFLLTLPHTVETRQWGDNLVFWVGDKAIGGKMFALISLDGHTAVASFSAGAEAFAELVEREGLIPAPYMARIFWVAAERWSSLRNTEWQDYLRAARDLTYAKLPMRVRKTLDIPATDLAKLIAAQRTALEAKATAKAATKSSRRPVSRASRSRA